MSSTEAAAADETCASCGVAGGVDIKLKKCGACDLVRYCGVECQRNHRPQHKAACKKRAAEWKDELLFKQPESTHLGDCPICLLPIPIATSQETMKYTVYSCCSKFVCIGCTHANALRQIEEKLPFSCPFCRHPIPKTKAETDLYCKQRVEANDPLALCQKGMDRFEAGENDAAIEYWDKAVGLDDIESHYHLSIVYREGQGVEKVRKKYAYHAEQAAIGGHVLARHYLGAWELEKGNTNRAVKHFIIAANFGCDFSIKELKKGYTLGMVSKEDFAAALRAYQAAVDATKSPQRDTAESARKMYMGDVCSKDTMDVCV